MTDRRTRTAEEPRRRKKSSPTSSTMADSRARAQPVYDEPSSYNAELSSSSSSSSSYIDISRTFPSRGSRGLSAIRTFFTAPSEHRRVRRRKSRKLLRFANSSTSSVNSDLAYGTGFIKRRKGQSRPPQRQEAAAGGDNRPGRLQGDAALLAMGAELAALARKQNRVDLMHSRQSGSASFKRQSFEPSRDAEAQRGTPISRPSRQHRPADEEGWESASEDESDASSIDPRLAYGNHVPRPIDSGRPRPVRRKSSVVDPSLFGPQNSLHGVVHEPVGHGVVYADFSQTAEPPTVAQDPTTLRRAESTVSSAPSRAQSMQYVYPMPTSDPTQFDVTRRTSTAPASRPAPIPIQQPQPIAPVSKKVFEPEYATRSEPVIPTKRSRSSSHTSSIAGAALAGVAASAVGAAIVADRRDDRRPRDGDRKDNIDEDRKIHDNKRKDSVDDECSKIGKSAGKDGRREKRDPEDEEREARREARRQRRREEERQEAEEDAAREARRERRRREEEAEEDAAREARRERRRREEDSAGARRQGGRKDESSISQKERPKENDVSYDDRGGRREKEQAVSKDKDVRSESRRAAGTDGDRTAKASDSDPVDPFQYQVADDAFPTPDGTKSPKEYTSKASKAPLKVVTVERVPHFAREDDSYEPRTSNGRQERAARDVDDSDERDERRETYRMHDEAERIYRETEESTAPIDAAAISAAVAAVTADDSRKARRASRDRSGRRKAYEPSSPEERDYVQEEADRAYREAVLARKIASERDEERDGDPIVRIVTPPGMDDKKKKGPFDAPDADFQLDRVMDPYEFRGFTPLSARSYPSEHDFEQSQSSEYPSKRPMLILVRPTPTSTPTPESQITKSGPRKSKPKEEESEQSAEPPRKKEAAPEIVIGPRGDIVPASPGSTPSKGVRWGENETKHYDAESPGEHRNEFFDDVAEPSTSAAKNEDEPRSTKKRSGWGAIAAGIVGAGGAALAKGKELAQASSNDKTSTEDHDTQDSPMSKAVTRQPKVSDVAMIVTEPPLVGPKPSSSSSHMPGAFDDDLGFAATVAAGLQESGFDPEIVIKSVDFRRRSSPPGSGDQVLYRQPFAETVSDLGVFAADSPGHEGAPPVQGFVLGEVPDIPQEEKTIEPEDFAVKRSKKDARRREKEESSRDEYKKDRSTRIADTDAPVVEEPESYVEPKSTKKAKKDKKAKRLSYADDDGDDDVQNSSKVSVPVDAFDDLRNDQEPTDAMVEDEWSAPKKSKKKSKKSSDRYDSPSRPDPADVPLPSTSDGGRDDYEEPTRSRKSSKRDSVISEQDTQSIGSRGTSQYNSDNESRASSKKNRNKDKDRSKEKDKKEKSGGFFGLFGSSNGKSETEGFKEKEASKEPSMPDYDEPKKKSKKSKRDSLSNESSIYGRVGADSVTDVSTLSRSHSNGNGYDDLPQEDSPKKRSSSKSSSNGASRSKNGDDREKESFLAETGTLGAGVGIALAAAAMVAQHQQSKAEGAESTTADVDVPSSTGLEALDSQTPPVQPEMSLQDDTHITSTEVSERQFRPSIDPRYGDLLPLPPSDTVESRIEDIDKLPPLPESRPGSPRDEPLYQSSPATVKSRRVTQQTPVKTPSDSAVPLSRIFMKGHGATPSSPVTGRASPSSSPSLRSPTSTTFSRSRPRPTSWEASKEFQPLFLLDQNRRGSIARSIDFDRHALIPSSDEEASRSVDLDVMSSKHVLAEPVEGHSLRSSEKASEVNDLLQTASAEDKGDGLISKTNAPISPELEGPGCDIHAGFNDRLETPSSGIRESPVELMEATVGDENLLLSRDVTSSIEEPQIGMNADRGRVEASMQEPDDGDEVLKPPSIEAHQQSSSVPTAKNDRTQSAVELNRDLVVPSHPSDSGSKEPVDDIEILARKNKASGKKDKKGKKGKKNVSQASKKQGMFGAASDSQQETSKDSEETTAGNINVVASTDLDRRVPEETTEALPIESDQAEHGKELLRDQGADPSSAPHGIRSTSPDVPEKTGQWPLAHTSSVDVAKVSQDNIKPSDSNGADRLIEGEPTASMDTRPESAEPSPKERSIQAEEPSSNTGSQPSDRMSSDVDDAINLSDLQTALQTALPKSRPQSPVSFLGDMEPAVIGDAVMADLQAATHAALPPSRPQSPMPIHTHTDTLIADDADAHELYAAEQCALPESPSPSLLSSHAVGEASVDRESDMADFLTATDTELPASRAQSPTPSHANVAEDTNRGDLQSAIRTALPGSASRSPTRPRANRGSASEENANISDPQAMNVALPSSRSESPVQSHDVSEYGTTLEPELPDVSDAVHAILPRSRSQSPTIPYASRKGSIDQDVNETGLELATRTTLPDSRPQSPIPSSEVVEYSDIENADLASLQTATATALPDSRPASPHPIEPQSSPKGPPAENEALESGVLGAPVAGSESDIGPQSSSKKDKKKAKKSKLLMRSDTFGRATAEPLPDTPGRTAQRGSDKVIDNDTIIQFDNPASPAIAADDDYFPPQSSKKNVKQSKKGRHLIRSGTFEAAISEPLPDTPGPAAQPESDREISDELSRQPTTLVTPSAATEDDYFLSKTSKKDKKDKKGNKSKLLTRFDTFEAAVSEPLPGSPKEIEQQEIERVINVDNPMQSESLATPSATAEDDAFPPQLSKKDKKKGKKNKPLSRSATFDDAASEAQSDDVTSVVPLTRLDQAAVDDAFRQPETSETPATLADDDFFAVQISKKDKKKGKKAKSMSRSDTYDETEAQSQTDHPAAVPSAERSVEEGDLLHPTPRDDLSAAAEEETLPQPAKDDKKGKKSKVRPMPGTFESSYILGSSARTSDTLESTSDVPGTTQNFETTHDDVVSHESQIQEKSHAASSPARETPRDIFNDAELEEIVESPYALKKSKKDKKKNKNSKDKQISSDESNEMTSTSTDGVKDYQSDGPIASAVRELPESVRSNISESGKAAVENETSPEAHGASRDAELPVQSGFPSTQNASNRDLEDVGAEVSQQTSDQPAIHAVPPQLDVKDSSKKDKDVEQAKVLDKSPVHGLKPLDVPQDEVARLEPIFAEGDSKNTPVLDDEDHSTAKQTLASHTPMSASEIALPVAAAVAASALLGGAAVQKADTEWAEPVKSKKSKKQEQQSLQLNAVPLSQPGNVQPPTLEVEHVAPSASTAIDPAWDEPKTSKKGKKKGKRTMLAWSNEPSIPEDESKEGREQLKTGDISILMTPENSPYVLSEKDDRIADSSMDKEDGVRDIEPSKVDAVSQSEPVKVHSADIENSSEVGAPEIPSRSETSGARPKMSLAIPGAFEPFESAPLEYAEPEYFPSAASLHTPIPCAPDKKLTQPTEVPFTSVSASYSATSPHSHPPTAVGDHATSEGSHPMAQEENRPAEPVGRSTPSHDRVQQSDLVDGSDGPNVSEISPKSESKNLHSAADPEGWKIPVAASIPLPSSPVEDLLREHNNTMRDHSPEPVRLDQDAQRHSNAHDSQVNAANSGLPALDETGGTPGHEPASATAEKEVVEGPQNDEHNPTPARQNAISTQPVADHQPLEPEIENDHELNPDHTKSAPDIRPEQYQKLQEELDNQSGTKELSDEGVAAADNAHIVVLPTLDRGNDSQAPYEIGHASERGSRDQKKGKKASQARSVTAVDDDPPMLRPASDTATQDSTSETGLIPAAKEAPSNNPSSSLATGYDSAQLSLAKQLQAEYEVGAKRTKKGKKSRSMSIRPDAIDDNATSSDTPNGLETQEPMRKDASTEAQQESSQGSSVKDAFTEEQLQLAQQMREEFSSRKKRSKKDKKNRSSSRTPPNDDSNGPYFDRVSHSPPRGTPAGDEEDAIFRTPAEDFNGLPRGYNGEQLELARQMQEEFTPGSKKSKKDRKRQDQQSSSRNEDLQDGALGESDLPASTIAPANQDESDNYADLLPVSKKSKKDKKRQSLLRTLSETSADTRAASSVNLDNTVANMKATFPDAGIDTAEVTSSASRKDKMGKKARKAAMTLAQSEGLLNDDNEKYILPDKEHAPINKGDEEEGFTGKTNTEGDSDIEDPRRAEMAPPAFESFKDGSEQAPAEISKAGDENTSTPTSNAQEHSQVVLERAVATPLPESSDVEESNDNRQRIDSKEQVAGSFPTKPMTQESLPRMIADVGQRGSAVSFGTASLSLPIVGHSQDVDAHLKLENNVPDDTAHSASFKFDSSTLKHESIKDPSVAPQADIDTARTSGPSATAEAETVVVDEAPVPEEAEEFVMKKSRKDKKTKKRSTLSRAGESSLDIGADHSGFKTPEEFPMTQHTDASDDLMGKAPPVSVVKIKQPAGEADSALANANDAREPVAASVMDQGAPRRDVSNEPRKDPYTKQLSKKDKKMKKPGFLDLDSYGTEDAPVADQRHAISNEPEHVQLPESSGHLSVGEGVHPILSSKKADIDKPRSLEEIATPPLAATATFIDKFGRRSPPPQRAGQESQPAVSLLEETQDRPIAATVVVDQSTPFDNHGDDLSDHRAGRPPAINLQTFLDSKIEESRPRLPTEDNDADEVGPIGKRGKKDRMRPQNMSSVQEEDSAAKPVIEGDKSRSHEESVPSVLNKSIPAWKSAEQDAGTSEQFLLSNVIQPSNKDKRKAKKALLGTDTDDIQYPPIPAAETHSVHQSRPSSPPKLIDNRDVLASSVPTTAISGPYRIHPQSSPRADLETPNNEIKDDFDDNKRTTATATRGEAGFAETALHKASAHEPEEYHPPTIQHESTVTENTETASRQEARAPPKQGVEVQSTVLGTVGAFAAAALGTIGLGAGTIASNTPTNESTKKQEESEKDKESGQAPNLASEANSARGRKSKKDKRRKIVDRRSSQHDDVFDDPALWEGAEPQPFKEASDVHTTTLVKSHKPSRSTSPDNTPSRSRSPMDYNTSSTHAVGDATLHDAEIASEHAAVGRERLYESDQPSHVIEHNQNRSDLENKDIASKQADGSVPTFLNYRHMGQAQVDNHESVEKFVKEVDEEHHSKTPSIQDVAEPGLYDTKTLPGRADPQRALPSQSARTLATIEKGDSESSHEDLESRDLPGRKSSRSVDPTQEHVDNTHDRGRSETLDQPASPHIKSYKEHEIRTPIKQITTNDVTGNHRLADRQWSTPTILPVLIEEESPRSQDHEHNILKHEQSARDLNRDSGFVADSPVPSTRAIFHKPHEKEPVRDSGVHLRDTSPALSDREANVSRSDVAIARLSWPAVDEDAETVDLKKSQRSRDSQLSRKHPANSAAPLSTGLAAVPGLTATALRLHEHLNTEHEVASRDRTRSETYRLQTPEHHVRPGSVNSIRSSASGTPPLRRSDRKFSGDLRSLSQRSQLNLAKEAKEAERSPAVSIVNDSNPVANEGRVRTKDMADVYDGYGEGRIGSPRSPTRPHSMRRRQSMQVLDLEARLEQLAAENRMLAEGKAEVEQNLQESRRIAGTLADRDAELESLKSTLDWLHREVDRLKEVNDGLSSANVTLGAQHNERYGHLESEHAQATRDLRMSREAHGSLEADMENMVHDEVARETAAKADEIAQLRRELEAAQSQIRVMQQQILAAKANEGEFLTVRDEDYFDNACQQLCGHVQQWVLRFSKFSDMRACRLTSEINNDKIIDRLDNAVLDGSDVDVYLSDRVKRRDIFMSMTMSMIWEFVFTRYLFGMDREQRQKLKSLEKTLSEVGPPAAVHQWRAVTLTLLSKRTQFFEQREQDTEAVVQMVFGTLSEILPPPSHLEEQIQEQLRRVLRSAVELSIEMRTQRAEYMMLPPLQPEYDANGDLADTVSFNAGLMNERSGDTVTNEELEQQKAVVRVVLFPLVVKKGDDNGEGDEEIVVCPAQVLVAKPKRNVRMFSPNSVAGASRISMQSSMPEGHADMI